MQFQTIHTTNVAQGGAITVPSSSPITLSKGDVLKGSVSSLSDGIVTLQLQDGRTLQAQITPGVEIRPGQEIALFVSGKSDGKIMMQLLHGDAIATQDGSIKDSPIVLNNTQAIANDPRSTKIYAWMREFGLSPTKEAFARVEQMLSLFPAIDDQTAVFLAANVKTLPTQVPSESLRALVASLTQPNAVTQPIETLLALLESQVASTPIPSLPNATSAVHTQAQAVIGAPTPAQSFSEATSALSRYLMQADPEGYRILSATNRLPEATAQLLLATGLPAEQAKEALRSFVFSNVAGVSTDATPGQPLVSPETVRLPPSLLPAMERVLLSLPSPELPMGQTAPATQTPPQPTLPTQPPVETLPVAQANLSPTTQANAAPTTQPTLTLAQDALRVALQNFANETTRTAVNPPLATATLPSAKVLLAQTQALYATLPSEGTNAQELQRGVTTLLSQLTTMRTSLASTPANAQAASLLYQADTHAQSLPQIQQFHYLQIPVQLYDKRQSAELYIMQRPKADRKEKDEFTILLALDTQHMGRVETVLRALDTSVSITFRMALGEATKLVKDSFPVLEESVEQLGFVLQSATIAKMQEPVTPQTFESVLKSIEQTTHRSLDVVI